MTQVATTSFPCPATTSIPSLMTSASDNAFDRPHSRAVPRTSSTDWLNSCWFVVELLQQIIDATMQHVEGEHLDNETVERLRPRTPSALESRIRWFEENVGAGPTRTSLDLGPFGRCIRTIPQHFYEQLPAVRARAAWRRVSGT